MTTTVAAEPGRTRVRGKTGMTFEEFQVGERFVSAARTVTEADVVQFAGLSGDYNPLHTDELTAANTPFGGRIAHGLLVVSMASGLANRLGIFEGTTLALLEQTLSYRSPVRFGDTIHLELEVASKRETKKLDRGLVELLAEVRTGDGTVAIDGTWRLLMLRSAAGSGDGESAQNGGGAHGR